MDIDWSRYDTDPAYKADVTHRIKRTSDEAAMILSIATAGFTLPGGVYVHVYLMPWTCLTEALKIATAIGARNFYVSCVGGDQWLYAMPTPKNRARRPRAAHC